VLDVGLPGMDGFEFLRRLRSANNKVLVLVLTARDALNERYAASISAPTTISQTVRREELLAR